MGRVAVPISYVESRGRVESGAVASPPAETFGCLSRWSWRRSGRSWLGTSGRPSGCGSGPIWVVHRARSTRMRAGWPSTCWSVSATASTRWPRTGPRLPLFVRELTNRPSRRGANVVALDSGAGLANATLQQRLVPVRLFYDFLIEEGLRESNPVGRGRYTPGAAVRRRAARPLVPRMVKLPWIPAEQQWLRRARGVPRRADPQPGDARAGLRRGAAPRGAVLAAHRRPRPGAPHAAGPGGDDQDPPGTGRALLGADRGAAGAATCGTGPRSAGPGVRCSCRSRAATTPSR